jgi:hypothetical protein
MLVRVSGRERLTKKIVSESGPQRGVHEHQGKVFRQQSGMHKGSEPVSLIC